MNSETVRSLFNDLSPNYDRLNRLFSLGMDVSWRKQLVAAVARKNPVSILDLACGSGDIATMLRTALPTAQIVGLDFSRPLLARAKERGIQKLTEADALKLPFPEASFEGVTLAFGLRNFSDRSAGLQEIARILKPGGVFGLLEFSPPPMPWKLFWNFYLQRLMPGLAQLVAGHGESFRYLARSISEFPTPSFLHRELSGVGLKLLFSRCLSARLVHLTVSIRA